ncbi:hypothetical protein GCM10009722_34660 [Williamsia deligens]
MIVSTPAGDPVLEIVRDRHPVMGVVVRVRQNPRSSVLVPVDSLTALADALVDAAERLEGR